MLTPLDIFRGQTRATVSANWMVRELTPPTTSVLGVHLMPEVKDPDYCFISSLTALDIDGFEDDLYVVSAKPSYSNFSSFHTEEFFEWSSFD
jgi:hypothetical protein